MKRTKIDIDVNTYPDVFRPFFAGAEIYDSSCSPEARVIFIDKDRGYYLKSAERGTLKREAEMTAFFHSKGLGTEVLEYLSGDRDWMLTERVVGEDCTHPQYTEDPKRLCDLLATLLRELHETDFDGCPMPDRTAEYLATAERNYKNGIYDASLFPDNWGYASAEDAWRVIAECGHLLKTDTLLHGDYCLPNIMLNDWKFSKFIDVDHGGVGDRHIDLFWGAWSLFFNLKTDEDRERFFDAYGRDVFEPEMLRVIAAAEVFG